MQAKTGRYELTFNWILPFLSALGFGVGFGLLRAISNIRLTLVQNAYTGVTSDIPPSFGEFVLRGLIIGGIGGIALGLAHGSRREVIHFALAGAIGFASALAAVISFNPAVLANVGLGILHFFGESEPYYPFGLFLAKGLGAGAIVGAMGGGVLGLASPKGKILSSLSLCFTGAVWFTIAFGIDATNTYRNRWFWWDGLAGAIGGALLGLTLALVYLNHNKISMR